MTRLAEIEGLPTERSLDEGDLASEYLVDEPTSEASPSPARISRADLLRRAEFEREAMLHLDALYSFALKLSRSRDDAEDLVSDTMLRALERWEQYRLGTNIRAWLFTILYHLFVSRKRRIDAREVLAPDDSDGGAPFEPVGETDPEGAFYNSFIDEQVVAAIQACGSLGYSRDCAQRYARDAAAALEGLDDNDFVAALRGLAQYSVNRDH